MQTYEILVEERSVKAGSADTTLVRTSVGIDQVHVLFDNAEWLEFPITITFGQGETLVTESLVVNEVVGSEDWVAEATATVPWEVIRSVGQVRVTIQGTDANGRHIITAQGAPLSIVEAGDVANGDVPQDAPTTDQWNQAYASAMEVANLAASIVENLQSQIDSIVSDAEIRIASMVSSVTVPATTSSLGVVQIGDGIDVDEHGMISASYQGLTSAQEQRLTNLGAFVRRITDASIDDASTFSSCTISHDVMPIASLTSAGAVKVDGTTITIDNLGIIHGGIDVRYEHVGNSSYLRKALVVGNTADGTYSFIDMLSIPSSAFRSCQNLRSITFTKCRTIGESAFFSCYSLMTCIFNDCVTVGKDAFGLCTSLQDAYLSNCETLLSSAFAACSSLSYISLPKCKQIGTYAFQNCQSLSSISLPAVEVISRGAFARCTNLKTIDMRGVGSVPYLDITDGLVFSSTKIASGSGRILVPSSLYESFVTNHPWSMYSSMISY